MKRWKFVQTAHMYVMGVLLVLVVFGGGGYLLHRKFHRRSK